MESIYTDAGGHRYRAIGQMPYSELTAGSPFALPADGPRVYFRGHRGIPRGNNWLGGLLREVYHKTLVIALERIEEG